MSSVLSSPTVADSLRERVQSALAEEPNAMTMQLAQRFAVPEADILRALPPGRVVELESSQWEAIIRDLEPLGKVHVIISNGAATLETSGVFKDFSIWGGFFNVQSPSLDMHIRYDNLGSIFALEKPSHMNGVNTLSIQFYDRQGHAAFKVFLNFGGPVTPERQAIFEQLRAKYRKPTETSADGN